jgi:hypothetical protein
MGRHHPGRIQAEQFKGLVVPDQLAVFRSQAPFPHTPGAGGQVQPLGEGIDLTPGIPVVLPLMPQGRAGLPPAVAGLGQRAPLARK